MIELAVDEASISPSVTRLRVSLPLVEAQTRGQILDRQRQRDGQRDRGTETGRGTEAQRDRGTETCSETEAEGQRHRDMQ